jgi:hypothetical protein
VAHEHQCVNSLLPADLILRMFVSNSRACHARVQYSPRIFECTSRDLVHEELRSWPLKATG